MYGLIPAGLHGENGITPNAPRKIFTAYILPRLLYGMGALILSKTEMANIDITYKNLPKSLFSLRDDITDEAVYFLIVLLPAEVELHVRIFSLFGGITRLEQNHPLLRLVLRQATYPPNKKGLFNQVFSAANKHDIKLRARAESKSTLKYL